MSSPVIVKMCEYKIVKKPDTLITLGLGSCVGICIYDLNAGISGMAHIMLPSALRSRDVGNIGKFADTAIPAMVNAMIAAGAKKKNLLAKIAGGAQMFAFSTGSDAINIGQKNVTVTKDTLKELEIRIVAEDTGGNKGRTIELFSENGSLTIKTTGKELKVL